MRQRERGVTLIGWVFLLLPLAMVGYAGIRLTPVYLEYMKISRTLEQVSEEYKGDQPSVETIRDAIEKRFDVEDVRVISARDAAVVKIRREGRGFTVQAVYADSVPYVSNIMLLAEFDKVVTIDD